MHTLFLFDSVLSKTDNNYGSAKARKFVFFHILQFFYEQ